MTQILLQKTRDLNKALFVSGSHDFSTVARNALAFAFRQYLLEQALGLGNYWERVVSLYYAGHWPIAYAKDILFVI